MVYFIGSKDINYSDSIKYSTIEDLITYLSTVDEIGLDFEATGFFPQANPDVLLAIGNNSVKFVIDTVNVDIRPLKEQIETTTLLIHNAFYDLRYLYYYGIVPKKVFDTFLCEKILTMGLKQAKRDYATCVKNYCNITLSKEERKDITFENYLRPGLIEYAANDVMYLSFIKEKQLVKIKENNLENALKLDNEFIRVLAYIGYCGFKLAKEVLLSQIKDLELKLGATENKLNNQLKDIYNKPKPGELFAYIPSINWASPAQLVGVMKELGVSTQRFNPSTKKYKDSTDGEFLEKNKDKHPIFPLLLEYRKYTKLLSTYGYNLIEQYDYFPDGRIRSTFNPLVSTGRVSSGGKLDINGAKKSMCNFQNIPKEGVYRHMWVAEEGNDLIVTDYSQQESRILADFSGDPVLIETIGKGDMHCDIARIVYIDLNGKDNDEIKEHYADKRQHVKTITFLIPYGGNASTIMSKMGFTLERSEKIYNKVLEKYPGMKQYFEKAAEETVKRGYVIINPITNRKSYVDYLNKMEEYRINLENNVPADFVKKYGKNKWGGLSSAFWQYRKSIKNNEYKYKEISDKYGLYRFFYNDLSKKGLNYPIQGTGADMIKLASIKLFNYIIENDLFDIVKINNVIHDEIVTESPKNLSKTLAKKTQYYMEYAAKVFCRNIDIPAEPKISEKWIK